MKAQRRVERLESIAPAVDPVTAKRRSLLLAFYDSMDTDDAKTVARKIMDQAHNGCRKSQALAVDILHLADQQQQLPPMQQVNVLNGQAAGESELAETPSWMLSEFRENLVRLIVTQGPMSAPALAQSLHCSLERVLVALNDHHWFEKSSGAWGVTSQGKKDVLPETLPSPVSLKRKAL